MSCWISANMWQVYWEWCNIGLMGQWIVSLRMMWVTLECSWKVTVKQ